jgi:hypothetical protein
MSDRELDRGPVRLEEIMPLTTGEQRDVSEPWNKVFKFYVHSSVNHKSILINVQRDATICSLYFILLRYHSTCFGCRLHPSPGVHKTVVTATGTSHMIVQLLGHVGVR